MTSIANLMDFVTVEGTEPETDSRKVAKHFGKRHDNVLRDVRTLVADTGEWGVLNFEETPFVDTQNGQTYDRFRMTKDGFMLLVMGFTGKKALGVKLAYIKAFNAMAELLRSGLWQRRLDAEAAYLSGMGQASIDGRALRRWRVEKPRHVALIADLDRRMQIPLELN